VTAGDRAPGGDKNFRARYEGPEHFLWDESDRPRIQFDGYTRIVQALLPPPPIDVLDAGCGDGLFSRRLQEAGYRVSGIDFSERAIGFARILAPGAAFEVLDVRALAAEPAFEHRFDAAVLVEVLEHVAPADHARVLAGLFRTVRPGGCLVVTVPSVHLKPVNRWHYKHFTLTECRDLLAAAGFTVTDIVGQRRPSVLWSPWFWRLVQNRYYDVAVARRGLRRLLLWRWNVADDPERAGRYVVKGVKG